MSQFRRRIRIVVDGRTVDLVTSARDFASAEIDGDIGAMDSVIRLAHAAAIRLHVTGIPSDVDTFADLLDEFVDLEKDEDEKGTVANLSGKVIDETEPDPIRATA